MGSVYEPLSDQGTLVTGISKYSSWDAGKVPEACWISTTLPERVEEVLLAGTVMVNVALASETSS